MLRKGLIGYLPANLVQAAVGVLSIYVFTRVLTPAAFGDYAMAFSIMSLAHTAGFVWLEASMARFSVRASERDALASHIVTVYALFAGVALLFPAVVAAGALLAPLSPSLKRAVVAGLAGVIVRSVVKLVQERRRAEGRVLAASGLDMLATGGGFAAGAALAASGLGAAGPLIGLGIAALACLAISAPSELRAARGGAFQPGEARAFAAYGFPIALSLVFSLVLATTDRLMLGAYSGPAAVGAYHAGYSLANRTLDVLFIWLGAAGGPAAVAALERGGHPALMRTARDQASVMISLALPAAVGVALVAHPLADVLVGPDLRAGAARVTPWIAVSALLSGVTTYYFHTAFTLARRTGRLLAAMAAPAALNVGLCALLIPAHGVDGAVRATAASYAAGAVASWALGRRTLALPIPWPVLAKAVAASGLMAAVVTRLPSPGGAAELFLKSGAGVLVYGAVALLLDLGGIRALAPVLVRRVREGVPA